MTIDVESFRALHVPGKPLVLYNIWDPGSAKAVAVAGAPALATGSYGVAEAFGAGDGEKLPFADVIANLERIIAVVEVPVSLDIETGYGADPAAVRARVQAAREAGAVGINMEDRLPGETEVLPLAEAARRIEAAAASGLFVNARTDVFKGRDPAPALVEEALKRARVYADAGASGLFVPFLTDAACARDLRSLPAAGQPDRQAGTRPAGGNRRDGRGPHPRSITDNAKRGRNRPDQRCITPRFAAMTTAVTRSLASSLANTRWR